MYTDIQLVLFIIVFLLFTAITVFPWFLFLVLRPARAGRRALRRE